VGSSQPTLAVNVLTRNAGRLVVRALESVGPVSEVVIIDTGSTDDSKKILEDYLQERSTLKRYSIVDFSPKTHPQFYIRDEPESFPGLSLQSSEYTGKEMLADFAAARQEGLAHTTSDFVFYLDSDDVIKSSDSFGEIPKVISYLDRHEKDLGITPYVHRFLSPADGGSADDTPPTVGSADGALLTAGPAVSSSAVSGVGSPCSIMARSSFGRVGSVHWEGAVHEHLVCKTATYGESAPGNKEVVFEAPVTIDLFDRHDPGSRVPFRNLKILHRAFTQKYDRSSHILFHLGLECRGIFPQEALRYFKLFIGGLSLAERSKRSSSIIATAHVERGRIYEIFDSPMDAFGEYTSGCAICRDLPEAYFGLGRASYKLGSYDRAVDYLEEGLKLAKNKKTEFFMHDPIERKGKSRIFLALSLNKLGEHQKALSVWSEGKDVLPKEFAALRIILDRRPISPDKEELGILAKASS
jgi:glycosyltransferase involved in cell wall biosynthesis